MVVRPFLPMILSYLCLHDRSPHVNASFHTQTVTRAMTDCMVCTPTGIKGSRDIPPGRPLVRRRYGAVVGADGSKGFRYHEYTLVRIVEAPAADGSGRLERTVTEDRSKVLFHVMPKRTEKGRPSKSESEAPAKLWASLGVGLQQQGASVVPTSVGNPQQQQPTAIRHAALSSASRGSTCSMPPVPIPSLNSPAGTGGTPPLAGLSSGMSTSMPINSSTCSTGGGKNENPCHHLQQVKTNPSVASVAHERPTLALRVPEAMIAVISSDGVMLGLYTSQVDAWKAAKLAGASMWRCMPNSDVCERIQ